MKEQATVNEKRAMMCHMVLDSDLKDKVSFEANRLGMGISTYVRMILKQFFNNQLAICGREIAEIGISARPPDEGNSRNTQTKSKTVKAKNRGHDDAS